MPEDFDPNTEIIFDSFVKNDLEAAEKLYSLYPDWKYSEGELYVFDDENGIWKNDRNTFNQIVSRYTSQLWVAVKNRNDKLEASKVKSYGNTTFLFNQMLEKLKTLCVDDIWLSNSYSSSLGKLLFNNGYFDMKTNKFHYGFNKDIVFSGKIHQNYRPFTKKDEEYIESIKKSCQRCFQALRIEVNDEFGVLEKFLSRLPDALKPGGRVAMLTFHSGEDRRVKKAFQLYSREGIFREVVREPIRPSAEEIFSNPRARSAKLRWAVKA